MKHQRMIPFFFVTIVLLLIMLCHECYVAHETLGTVRQLQKQYYGHIAVLQHMLMKQQRSGEQAKRNIPLLDRHTDYLSGTGDVLNEQYKQTMEQALLKEQETHQELRPVESAQSEMMELDEQMGSGESAFVPQWAQTVHRPSETGITFTWPIAPARFWLSSLFGARKKPSGQIGFHQGIDMAACRGTDIYAAAAGIVEYAGYAPGYGNTIIIAHDVIYKTRYAHLDLIKVAQHDPVAQGTVIGSVGDTGFTIKQGRDASHLHFELYEHGKQVNPLPLISV